MTDEEILLSQQKLGVQKSTLQLDQDAVNNLLSNDFGFLTGNAGSGKSTLITELARLHPEEFELTATTGIAGINLGTKTIHSTLKFFDMRSLEDAFDRQNLHFNLRLVRARKKKLFIDEVSMLGAPTLEYIINAVDEINCDNSGKKLGVWVSGDFCQLPVIKDRNWNGDKNGAYAFEAECWDRFGNNTLKLTKVWRQTNKDFLDGINCLRQGKNMEAMELFKKSGVHFVNNVDDHFDGCTLIPKNEDVDIYNTKRLNELTTPVIRVTVITAGAQHKEWLRMIPFELRLKKGALVMILANDVPSFNYANGDLGVVEDYDPVGELFKIKLKRNNSIVSIKRIERLHLMDNEHSPTGRFQPYHDYKSGQWVAGWIRYFPLRLAWASTLHKSQGLSLDRVQINCRPQFFGYDSMGYVGISRAKTPDGLYLVGDPTTIARKIRMSSKVTKYV